MWVVAALAVSTVLGFTVLYRVSLRAQRRRRVEAQLDRIDGLPPLSNRRWDALADDVNGERCGIRSLYHTRCIRPSGHDGQHDDDPRPTTTSEGGSA